MDHSEGGKAPRKQGHHQLRRYQQCGASVGNTALTPAASPLHLTIPVADVATSQPFYLVIEGSASLLELTRDSAVRTSEHTCFLKSGRAECRSADSAEPPACKALGGRDRAGSRPGAVARLAPSAGQGEGAMGRQEARSRGDSWAAGDRRPARPRGRQRPGRGRPAAGCRVEG